MTIQQQMTYSQGQALARFLHELRNDWDAPGIEAALGHARHRAGGTDVAIAAINAAANHGNRTPAIISMDGPHWRKLPGGGPRPEGVGPERTCSTCSQPYDTCRLIWSGDHEFISVVEHARRAVKPDQGFFAELRDRMATMAAEASHERAAEAETRPRPKTVRERVEELDAETQEAIRCGHPGKAEYYAERASMLDCTPAGDDA